MGYIPDEDTAELQRKNNGERESVANVYNENMIIIDIKHSYFSVRRQRRRHRTPERIMVESDVLYSSNDEFNDVINDEFG